MKDVSKVQLGIFVSIVQNFIQTIITIPQNNYVQFANNDKVVYMLMQEQQDKLYQQNMTIIQRLQRVGAKVNLKQFPSVDLTKRLKRKSNSLSNTKFKSPRYRTLRKYQVKNQDQLFDQNMNMIEKIQTTQRKIVCWQDKTLTRSRKVQEKRELQNRNNILAKFAQISKQLQKLKVDKQSSKNLNSPYLKTDSHMKKTTDSRKTIFQTKKMFIIN